MTRSLTNYFDKLIGTPCWHVKQGYGSFLTFEFGLPNQEISRVRETKSSVDPTSHHRTVSIHGDWHLWIYCCGWRIFQEKRFLAHHESEKKQIEIACRALDGQAIESIDVDLNTVNTKFCFRRIGFPTPSTKHILIKITLLLFQPTSTKMTEIVC